MITARIKNNKPKEPTIIGNQIGITNMLANISSQDFSDNHPL